MIYFSSSPFCGSKNIEKKNIILTNKDIRFLTFEECGSDKISVFEIYCGKSKWFNYENILRYIKLLGYENIEVSWIYPRRDWLLRLPQLNLSGGIDFCNLPDGRENIFPRFMKLIKELN